MKIRLPYIKATLEAGGSKRKKSIMQQVHNISSSILTIGGAITFLATKIPNIVYGIARTKVLILDFFSHRVWWKKNISEAKSERDTQRKSEIVVLKGNLKAAKDELASVRKISISQVKKLQVEIAYSEDIIKKLREEAKALVEHDQELSDKLQAIEKA